MHVRVLVALALAFAPPGGAPAPAQSRVQAAPAPAAFAGLWSAKRRFGPDARGALTITREGSSFFAEIVGRTVRVRAESGILAFELPNDQGAFRGRFDGRRILGIWVRPGSPVDLGRQASPAILQADGPNRWRGTVAPAEDEFSFHLWLEPRQDGSLGAVLRNPERDIGTQYGVERLSIEGETVRLLGRRPGQSEREIARGRYDPEAGAILLDFPSRGRHYEFTRDGDSSDFWPRGREPGRYVYRPPPALPDGWRVAALAAQDIDRPAIERLVQSILEAPMNSTDAPQIHALLIARRGRLLLEEYFHGFHRDRLHTTRSAGKSVAAITVGAAIHSGAPLSLSSPVYQVMNGGTFPPDLDPRKRAMTLEHLLTMSSGYHCDDTDEEAPGNEETMTDQSEEPDYYRFTMRVPLATAPGEKSVYCSASPNLALGMAGRATGEMPVLTFHRLVAEPMQMGRYSWPLDPAGNPYGGGSVQMLPRDFLKIGQLMLDGGRWNGRRILGSGFAERSVAPLYRLRGIFYGYNWWVEDYPYKDRTVRSFSARGAGGQTVVAVPELELVVATMAGNYSGRSQHSFTGALVPRFILPAVRERGDDMSAPVEPRAFTSPYGRSPDGSRVVPPR